MLFGINRFILRILDNSLLGDHICSGDYIICERRQNAAEGNIIVALIDQKESALRKFRHNDDSTITLSPSNPQYPSMTYATSRVEIQGIYLGLLRVG